MLRNERGSILLFVYVIIFVLLSLSASVISHSTIERKAFEITKQRAEAFYMAEAAMDNAVSALGHASNYLGTSSPVSVYRGANVVGQYECSVVDIGNSMRKITVWGYAPQKTVSAGVLKQVCQAEGVARLASSPPPPNFYKDAIFSAHDISFTGNSYDVTGNVAYADSISNFGRVAGTVTHDTTIAPLAHFDFQSMRNAAISQGNLYTATRLTNGDPFPSGFWYTPPTDPLDPTTGVPNCIYVEGNMVLKGNVTTGGFFLVVGNVLADPTVTSDTTINGNVTVNGAIYSTGNLTLNGGGNSMNINGGVWAGDDASFKGNAKVTYNTDYMSAIQNFVNNTTSSTVQLLSWRELQLYS